MRAQKLAGALGRTGRELRSLVSDVDWSISYVGFLVFIFIIVTYRVDIGDVAMAVALGGLIFEKREFRFPAPVAIFGLFLLWAGVGYTTSPYPDAVFESLRNFVRLWLITLVAVNVLDSRPRIRLFLAFFLLLFVTHPARGAFFNKFLYGFAEYGRVEWRGFYGNPNDLAALTFLPLGVAAALLKDRHRWIRWGAVASLVVLPCLILFTQSRGAILALALFGILALFEGRHWVRRAALAGLVILAVVVTAPTGAWERMGGLVNVLETGEVETAADMGSAEQRLMIWDVAVSVIEENPVNGVGLGAYEQAHEVHAASNPEWAFARGPRDVHNTYLNVLAETGVPGFLLFLGLLGSVLWKVARARRTAREDAAKHQLRYLEIGLYAYLFASVFATYNHLIFLYLHLALLFGMSRVVRRRARERAVRAHRSPAARLRSRAPGRSPARL